MPKSTGFLDPQDDSQIPRSTKISTRRHTQSFFGTVFFFLVPHVGVFCRCFLLFHAWNEEHCSKIWFLVNSLHFHYKKAAILWGYNSGIRRSWLSSSSCIGTKKTSLPGHGKDARWKLGWSCVLFLFFCRVLRDDVLLQVFEMETDDGAGNELSK